MSVYELYVHGERVPVLAIGRAICLKTGASGDNCVKTTTFLVGQRSLVFGWRRKGTGRAARSHEQPVHDVQVFLKRKRWQTHH